MTKRGRQHGTDKVTVGTENKKVSSLEAKKLKIEMRLGPSLHTPSGTPSSSAAAITAEIGSVRGDSRDFVSCLMAESSWSIKSPDTSDTKLALGIDSSLMLKRCLSITELPDESWLSSSLIDLVISTFSKRYTDVYFLPIDFVVMVLTSSDKELKNVTDIIGRKVDFQSHKPIVFICNAQNIHWNMIRIVFSPEPELQLFEPMGKPTARRAGLNYRSIPRGVVKWLNLCYPLPKKKSWQALGISAITYQQQFTTFDCGVACLLYAEKAGLGHTREEINSQTSQEDITEYRQTIKTFVSLLS